MGEDTCMYCGSPEVYESETACINVFGKVYTLKIPEGQVKPKICKDCNRTQNLKEFHPTLQVLKNLVLSSTNLKAS